MTDLSQEQIEKRASIQKSATIFGVIVGGIAGLIALWALGGQGAAIRYGGAIVIALVLGVLVYRGSYASNAKAAACENCGATFSRSRTDKTEVPTGSEPKEERTEQEDGSTKVTTWIEEQLDVTETYTCSSCNDVSTKTYKTTRRINEEEMILQPSTKGGQDGVAPEPTPDAPAKKSSKGGKSGSGKSGGGKGEAG